MIAFRPALFRFLQRAVACGSAGLLLALAIFAASPDLHGELHDDHAHHHDGTCAIALYSSGVELPAGQVAAQPGAGMRVAKIFSPASRRHLAPPRNLLPPERGPPAARR